MSKRISVTERILEDRPVGRGFDAIVDGPREGNNTKRRDEKGIRDPERQSAHPHSSELIKATFFLDRESVEILDRIWLRQRRRDGQSKSALVRQAIHWFRAKPANRIEQIMEAIGSAINWAVVEGQAASRRTIAVIVTVAATVVGSLFIGGALWLAEGHRGAGDAMGIGILTSLGATLILIGFGTALTCIVTYVAGLPAETAAGDGAAPQEAPAKEPDEAPHDVRPERRSRTRRSLRQQT